MSHHWVSLRSGRVETSRVSTATKPLRLRHPLVQALCRMMRAFSRWRASRRCRVLHRESLNEYLLRDLGLTNHVEQPRPGRRHRNE